MAQTIPDPVGAAAAKAGVNPRLFRELVSAESGGNPNAVSSAGARGLAQLMPGTARALEQRYKIDTSTPFGNLLGGAYYLKEQLDRFKTVPLALAAYNAGPGAVAKYGGIPPYRETQAYVSKITRNLAGSDYSNPAAAAPAAPDAPAPQAAAPDGRRAFAQQLLGTLTARGGKLDTGQLLGAVQGLRQSRLNRELQAPAAPLPTQTPALPSGTLPVQEQTRGGFNPDFASRLNAMVAASGGRLKVTSGYRSPERQAELYAAAVRKYGSEAAARKWVAPPGRSKHGEGVAADLGGDLDWAHKNAARFGLYFPMGHEPWHVEPVGSR